ncbi:ATP-binding protein [Granulicella sp. WH15]|nr:ATP-binding protein [Granulicella sp. WH15]
MPLHPDVAGRNQRMLAAAVLRLMTGLHNWVDGGRVGQVQGADSEEMPLQLERVTRLFGLSSFERRVLLAAVAFEIDSTFASVCAAAHADDRMGYPTFLLMLSAFEDAHWDALSPSSPLRSWNLITLAQGETVASSRMRIDERMLHFLLGGQGENTRLAGVWQPVVASGVPLATSQEQVATRIAALLTPMEGTLPPVIEILGADSASRQAVAIAAAANCGLGLGRVVPHLLPGSASDHHGLARLLEREAVLEQRAIFVPMDDLEAAEGARTTPLSALLEAISAPVMLGAEAPVRVFGRETVLFELKKPTVCEQSNLWREALGSRASSLNGSLDRLSTHFNLSSEAIYRNSAMSIALSGEEPKDSGGGEDKLLADSLWNTCRTQSRVRLDKLAQRVEADAGWDDLILPASEMRVLRTIALQMQHRMRVHERWGFRGTGGRGMGLTAIFAGQSGTGKTTAAEVLAQELRLDLFRVDLSHTISKYIGETSRNLRQIFDAAEEAGAILLFDEADALFGKRSEVRDSHDRFANAEVSYLLQRLELYRGLAILATNMKQAIDQAFLRRVRFVVQFPFPDAAMREAIWRRALPAEAPTEAINFHALSLLSVTGANIRNIALNGAFLAAAEGTPIRMAHLLEAAHAEADKLERAVPESEIEGWV